MTKKKTPETVGKKVIKKTLPKSGDSRAEAAALAKNTPNALADNTPTRGRTGSTGLKRTGKKIDTALMVEGGAIPNAADFVGPPTADLKEKFSAQKIPLQTNFSDLIDVADCGRKAVGLSPAQPGGTGLGLQTDGEDRLAVLPQPNRGINVSSAGVGVAVEANKGLAVGSGGLAVVAGNGITLGSAGVSINSDQLLVAGMIMMFSGAIAPPGWGFCDGANGRPNLLNRFILGGSGADVGMQNSGTMTGASTARNYSVTSAPATPPVSVSVSGCNLTLAQIPSHKHLGGPKLERHVDMTNRLTYGYQDVQTSVSFYGAFTGGTGKPVMLAYTSSEGSGAQHTHTASASQAAHSHSVNVVPLYYILAFIIKL